MFKKVIAVVLIIVTGGGWLYLDYRNKQELAEAEALRQSIMQARLQAEARARAAAEAKAKFEALILADLNTCKATAEKAKEDFLTQHQKPVRHKRGQFTVPQAAMDEAAKTLDAANAECQATYDKRLKAGS